MVAHRVRTTTTENSQIVLLIKTDNRLFTPIKISQHTLSCQSLVFANENVVRDCKHACKAQISLLITKLISNAEICKYSSNCMVTYLRELDFWIPNGFRFRHFGPFPLERCLWRLAKRDTHKATRFRLKECHEP